MSRFVLTLFVSVVVPSLAFAAQSSRLQDLECGGSQEEAQLINQLRTPPTDASGVVTYCRDAIEAFTAHVRLWNLFPKRPYALTLNGIINEPGNELLLRKCKRTRSGEGFCDIGEIVTENDGRFEKIIRFPLDPSMYIIKFLVKDIQAGFQVVLLNNRLVFTVRAPEVKTIEIMPPTADGKVGHTELVRGTLGDLNLHVYVFVHPLLTNLWWVQRRPTQPNPDGSWRSIVYFGTKQGKGIGEFFELVAVASPNANEFREGQTLSSSKMAKNLMRYPHTPTIVVQRTR